MSDQAVAPRFTVLLPVHRPPHLLPLAIESVLAQEERRLELFVVCDGAPAETVRCAQAYTIRDPRVRVFDFPKGERHGERHRHTALESARGELVAQLGDDDLWFPSYLDELGDLLEEVDFGNLLQVEMDTDGTTVVRVGDLAAAATRLRMLQQTWNFFGPTFAGYRLQAYRALPVGWTPAPVDLPTDLFMWRKFLAQPGLRFGTRFAVEGVKLAAATRGHIPADARAVEAQSVAELVSTPRGRREVRARAVQALHGALRAQLDGVLDSHSWTMTRPLRWVGRQRIRHLLPAGR